MEACPICYSTLSPRVVTVEEDDYTRLRAFLSGQFSSDACADCGHTLAAPPDVAVFFRSEGTVLHTGARAPYSSLPHVIRCPDQAALRDQVRNRLQSRLAPVRELLTAAVRGEQWRHLAEHWTDFPSTVIAAAGVACFDPVLRLGVPGIEVGRPMGLQPLLDLASSPAPASLLPPHGSGARAIAPPAGTPSLLPPHGSSGDSMHPGSSSPGSSGAASVKPASGPVGRAAVPVSPGVPFTAGSGIPLFPGEMEPPFARSGPGSAARALVPEVAAIERALAELQVRVWQALGAGWSSGTRAGGLYADLRTHVSAAAVPSAAHDVLSEIFADQQGDPYVRAAVRAAVAHSAGVPDPGAGTWALLYFGAESTLRRRPGETEFLRRRLPGSFAAATIGHREAREAITQSFTMLADRGTVDAAVIVQEIASRAGHPDVPAAVLRARAEALVAAPTFGALGTTEEPAGDAVPAAPITDALLTNALITNAPILEMPSAGAPPVADPDALLARTLPFGGRTPVSLALAAAELELRHSGFARLDDVARLLVRALPGDAARVRIWQAAHHLADGHLDHAEEILRPFARAAIIPVPRQHAESAALMPVPLAGGSGSSALTLPIRPDFPTSPAPDRAGAAGSPAVPVPWAGEVETVVPEPEGPAARGGDSAARDGDPVEGLDAGTLARLRGVQAGLLDARGAGAQAIVSWREAQEHARRAGEPRLLHWAKLHLARLLRDDEPDRALGILLDEARPGRRFAIVGEQADLGGNDQPELDEAGLDGAGLDGAGLYAGGLDGAGLALAAALFEERGEIDRAVDLLAAAQRLTQGTEARRYALRRGRLLVTLRREREAAESITYRECAGPTDVPSLIAESGVWAMLLARDAVPAELRDRARLMPPALSTAASRARRDGNHPEYLRLTAARAEMLHVTGVGGTSLWEQLVHLRDEFRLPPVPHELAEAARLRVFDGDVEGMHALLARMPGALSRDPEPAVLRPLAEIAGRLARLGRSGPADLRLVGELQRGAHGVRILDRPWDGEPDPRVASDGPVAVVEWIRTGARSLHCLLTRIDTAGPQPGQPSSGRPSSGRPSSGRPSSGRPNVAQPSSDRPSFERPNADRPNADRPSSDRPNAAQPGPERPRSERHSSGWVTEVPGDPLPLLFRLRAVAAEPPAPGEEPADRVLAAVQDPGWRAVSDHLVTQLEEHLGPQDRVVFLRHDAYPDLPWHLAVRDRWAVTYLSSWTELTVAGLAPS